MDIQLAISQWVGAHVEPEQKNTPVSFMIPADKLVTVCHELLHEPSFYFDMLSCLTGLDNGPEVGTMEVIYNLYSIPHNRHLMLRVVLSRENPRVDSVCHIWRTAEWHEREAFDMFGIVFNNHPDLRRILMPEDWVGHPLRKDYQHQDTYRNIKVEYHN
jgi:NADH-quinone oxidoreductase subunit C